jgi:hypothetical protein
VHGLETRVRRAQRFQELAETLELERVGRVLVSGFVLVVMK